MFTLQQTTYFTLIYRECRRCARKTTVMFNMRYPNNNLHQDLELVAKFNKTGFVANKKELKHAFFIKQSNKKSYRYLHCRTDCNG